MSSPCRTSLSAAIRLTLLCALCLTARKPFAHAQAQPSKPILTLLEPRAVPEPATSEAQGPALRIERGMQPGIQPPANFHTFPQLQEGKIPEGRRGTGEVQIDELTLGFTESTTLTSLKISTSEFQLLDGGTCAAGLHLTPADRCTVRVAFTPKGPGNRVAKLTVTHSSSAHPESVGLGGVNLAPAVSFVPSIIQTVPSTYNATTKQGVFANAYSLAIDGGDNLYIADLGGGTSSKPPVVDVIDSSGALTLYAGSGQTYAFNSTPATEALLATPQAIAADADGDLFVGDAGTFSLFQVDVDQNMSVVTGTPELAGFAGIAITPQENIYLSARDDSTEYLLGDGTINYYAQDPDADDQPASLAIDGNKRLYYSSFAYCQVRSVDPNDQYISIVAGTHTCGYSGDGGQARGAELNAPRQVATDAANNLYVADAGNYVIRRIDAATGLIHTIAGVAGKPGNAGNGGPATAASFTKPWGLAVDSNGSIYVADTTIGVVRKIGPIGNLLFYGIVGSISPVQTITVSNTGNSALNIAQVYWSGQNATDFATDPHTTTCAFLATGVGTLNSGQTCTIGIVFKPTVATAELAMLNFVDNTGLGLNTIQLNGTGQKKTPTIVWPTPAAITTATALSGTQLDATAVYAGAAVAGTFVYTPAAGATLAAGTHTLSVAFTPSNPALYNNSTGAVIITVNAAAIKPSPAPHDPKFPSKLNPTSQPVAQ